MKLSSVITAAVIIFPVAFLMQCGSDKTVEGEIIRPVRTLTVQAGGGERMRTFTGTIKAGQEAKLSFKVSGTMQRIHVKVGDKVKAGTLLAELDTKDYQLQVQQVEAGLDQARAQMLNAQSSYERVRGLYENRNASKSNLDAAKAAYESGKASVRSLEKQLELAKLRLSYTRLYAPVAGSIAGVNGEVNENVAAGRPVVVLTSGQKLEVILAIPEILITRVKEGEKAEVKVDALPDVVFDGTIIEVGVSSVNVGATFPVTVRIEGNTAKLRSGMSAEVSFSFASDGKKDLVIMVPSFAVGEDREGQYVFTVKTDTSGNGDKKSDVFYGIVERKAVKIGDITAEGLEILDGLTDGDWVVTAGISRIKPGQKVKLPTAK